MRQQALKRAAMAGAAMMSSCLVLAAPTPDAETVKQAQSVALSKAVEATADRHFQVVHNADGQPDLEGVWTNVSITPFERPAAYSGSAALSTQQAVQLEAMALDRFIEGNAPTDPNAPSTDTTSKHCQGAGGLDCGYNSGWKDSGTTVARVDGEPRSSFITSTANGRVPAYKAGYQGPQGRFSRDAGEGAAGSGAADNPENRGLGERCLTSFGNSAGPVMLPLMYNNNYQLVQSKHSVAIEIEMVHDVRMVHLNVAHRSDGLRPWFGDSIGHYEGNTLVVETTNFPKAQAFYGSWQDLRVTERFTRKGPHRMLYQFSVSDPGVWDQGWGGEYEFTSAKGRIFEYACHEGNYALAGILAGARAEEARANPAAASERRSGNE